MRGTSIRLKWIRGRRSDREGNDGDEERNEMHHSIGIMIYLYERLVMLYGLVWSGLITLQLDHD